MNQRTIEYRIKVTLKTLNGIFGSRSVSQEFWFCTSEPRDEAIQIAARNIPSRGWLYDERLVQVLDAIPTERREQTILLEHPQLRSLSEVQSEREESEAA